jgi:hypothetical protein
VFYLFIGVLTSYLRCLCLLTYSDVQHILRCVVFFFVLCTRCCQFLWIVLLSFYGCPFGILYRLFNAMELNLSEGRGHNTSLTSPLFIDCLSQAMKVSSHALVLGYRFCPGFFYMGKDPKKTTDLSQVTDKHYHIMLYTSPWSISGDIHRVSQVDTLHYIKTIFPFHIMLFQ